MYWSSSIAKSYLNVKAILEACCLTGADSIHPGYGFLSENVSFAKMCSEMGINYIGPSYELIELMGNKSKAKETMKKLEFQLLKALMEMLSHYKEQRK